MSDRESTQVGYRLRIQPSDLSTYPDRAKLVWFDFVVRWGLVAKDRDLARGLDKDGKPLRPLRPKSIKYRKSEVGPVHKTAPPLEPALAISRVRSLLIGRAHAGSAKFWWKFDSVSGKSFAAILRYQRDKYDRDVFGLSPRGTAWTFARAMKDWEAWKSSPEAGRLTAGRPSNPAARQVRKPIPEVTVRQNLEDYDLFPGAKSVIEKAIAEGRFPGFRRLNARGEQWKPGMGIPPAPPGTAPVKPTKPKPKPKPQPIPSVPKPQPAPIKPTSAPVSAAMNIQADSPRIQRHAKTVFELIDKIHSDGNLPQVPVKSFKANTGYEGTLEVNGTTGKLGAMNINRAIDHPHITIAHETGHVIDYAGIPRTAPQYGIQR